MYPGKLLVVNFLHPYLYFIAADFKEAGERLDVALQLARLRIKSSKTQAELARELKVSQQVISRMESPRHRIHSLQTIIRIAEALGGKVSLTIG